jgi:nicotinamidase-related amidase
VSQSQGTARLRSTEVALLVIDVQERLTRAMPPARAEGVVKSTVILLEAARRFGMPVVATEQYPEGLGPTVAPVADALARLQPAVSPIPKLEFSALGRAEVQGAVRAAARGTWIVVGLETHVCVWQTVRSLLDDGAAVHVVADASLSRREEDVQIGLELCRRAGAVITSTEVVVFDLLERAGTDDFRALSKLVR